MITYSLVCENQHTFDAWFRNGQAYEDQHRRAIVTCPICSSSAVEKAMMAPAVARAKPDKVAVSTGRPEPAQLLEMMRALRAKMISGADNVGDKFAEEARKIHFKEVEARGIYGEANREDVMALLEDGVDFMPLPSLPEEHN